MRNSYILQGFSIGCLFAGVVSVSTNQSTFISLALFSMSGICMFGSMIYDSFTSATNHTDQEIQHVYNLIGENQRSSQSDQTEATRMLQNEFEETHRQMQSNDRDLREVISNLEKENQKIIDHIIERIDEAFDELNEAFGETCAQDIDSDYELKPKSNRKK